MYMLRAYQSPYSAADWGPQWAQMPNLASRYQLGTRYSLSDSRVLLKGPAAIWGSSSAARASSYAGTAPASNVKASRLVIMSLLPVSVFLVPVVPNYLPIQPPARRSRSIHPVQRDAGLVGARGSGERRLERRLLLRRNHRRIRGDEQRRSAAGHQVEPLL